MSKFGVCKISKSKSSYCTLFLPKYWALTKSGKIIKPTQNKIQYGSLLILFMIGPLNYYFGLLKTMGHMLIEFQKTAFFRVKYLMQAGFRAVLSSKTITL